MRILIYGAGVIGSIFAGKLSLSGQDVSVLAWGKRLEEIRENGIVLVNPLNGKRETAPVDVIEKLLPGDAFDYVFVVMQRTQVDEILEVLAQNISRNIVFVVNTAAGYEKWIDAVGMNRLLLGFPSAGGERREGKVDYFIGKGIIRSFQTTTFGELNGQKTERLRKLIRIFNHAGIPSVMSKRMDAWQKTHVAMVTSIANALYKYNGDNYALAGSYKDIKLMVHGIREGFSVLNGLGYPITPRKLNYFKLPSCLLAIIFTIAMGTKMAEIAMSKHTLVGKAEIIHLQKEFDALIEKSGVHTPSINNLRQYLTLSE